MIIHMSLMAEKQKLSKEPLALYLCDSTTVVPDCIVIRFEVESLPQGTKDLLFNADMQDESQGTTIPGILKTWVGREGAVIHDMQL